MAEHSRVAWELGERFPSLPNPSWVNNHAFFLWPGQSRVASQETSGDHGASWRPRCPLPIARLLSRLSFSREFWRLLHPYVSSEQFWDLIWEVRKGRGICGNWNQAEQKLTHQNLIWTCRRFLWETVSRRGQGRHVSNRKHQSSTALAPDSSELLRRTGFLWFVFLWSLALLYLY